MLSNDELTRISRERRQRLEELQHKYPKATTDEFQKACLQWEVVYGGRGFWTVICPNHDMEKLVDSLVDIFDYVTGLTTGFGFRAFSERGTEPPVGFHVLCYEKAKDLVKLELMSMGIKESEMTWTPESELRKQFEEWKGNHGKQ